uniref:Uncharacterized protein n=1 Tax=Aureoumbra lagunensis TaxID=44058 RepID=A0A7S3JP62_9STRA|mmetsp:Transcript_7507/g.11231  ORF Transcript_7507/g.11231 Transcript_7507/m.11231 type:complete len:818 (-) Transcript_7507:172-2625(-)
MMLPQEERTYYSEKVIVETASSLKSIVNSDRMPKNIAPNPYTDKSVAPKVQRAFDNERLGNEPPRLLEIERKKREYAAKDLLSLIRERGLFQQKGNNLRLPIEWFDDEEYESRSIDAWLAAGPKINKGLPATVLHADGTLQENALAIDYVGGENNCWNVIFSVTPNHNSQEEKKEIPQQIPRLRICFAAEDPEHFIDRYVAAQRAAEIAQNLAIQALYADAIPIDEARDLLEPDLRKRILELTLSTKALRNAFPLSCDEYGTEYTSENQEDILRPLFRSIELSRASALARLIMPRHGIQVIENTSFCAHYKTKIDSYALVPAQALALPIDLDQSGSSRICKSQVFCQFRFKCCLTQPALCRIRELIRTECLKLMDSSSLLFPLPVKLPITLDDFTDAATAATHNAIRILNQTWPAAIAGHLNVQLRDVKKGCFDLQQTDDRVYASSKLKRVLQCINLQMQDALRTLTLQSIQSYVNTIEQKNTNESLRPLFVLELIAVDDNSCQDPSKKWQYDTDPQALKQAVESRMHSALESGRRIITVERRVMNRLFWARDPMLATLADNEIESMQKRLSQILDEGITHVLTKYMTNFDEYLELLNLDLEVYLKKIITSPPTTFDALEAAIPSFIALAAEHTELSKTFKNKFPISSPRIGLVHVDSSKVRDSLLEKQNSATRRILDAAATATITHARLLIDAFLSLIWPLQAAEQPETIEELEELQNQAKTFRFDQETKQPDALMNLMSRIDAVDRHFDLLDSIKYQFFDNDEATLRWQLLSTPQRLHDEAGKLLKENFREFERIIVQREEDAAAAAAATAYSPS